METTAAPATKTPGYNCRLTIWFDTNKNGQRVAYRWSHMRAIRMSVADAELFIATETADQISGHPMRAAK